VNYDFEEEEEGKQASGEGRDEEWALIRDEEDEAIGAQSCPSSRCIDFIIRCIISIPIASSSPIPPLPRTVTGVWS
jgi:hypothetical protein